MLAQHISHSLIRFRGENLSNFWNLEEKLTMEYVHYYTMIAPSLQFKTKTDIELTEELFLLLQNTCWST